MNNTSFSSGPPPGEIDLVIGWVAPVGTEIGNYLDFVRAKLTGGEFGFVENTIRVIRLIEGVVELADFPNFNSTDPFQQLLSRQDAGDRMRQAHPGALAAFVVDAIGDFRKSHLSCKRRLHLVKSLKHPEEALQLRRVYGSNFFLIGTHSSYDSRLAYLRGKCGSVDHAERLIERDEDEGLSHGQKTRDLFELCDAFIWHTAGNTRHARADLDRILELLFGAIDRPPTRDEYGMSCAYGSAEQSSDLARQVGAALFGPDGILLCTGRNDVAKGGGGVYRFGESPDYSDMALGHDYGQRARDILINQALQSIVESGCDSTLSAYRAEIEQALQASNLRDIVEYGRSVHAEMDVITSCARNGIRTSGAHLYVTTFPCHNCARHIIASGISSVTYLEPYRKSRALGLHSDAIECQAMRSHELALESGEYTRTATALRRVAFEPFVGISPRRYSDFFSLRTSIGEEIRRKDANGRLLSRIQHLECDAFAVSLYRSLSGSSAGKSISSEPPLRILRVPSCNEGLFDRESLAMAFLLSKLYPKSEEVINVD